MIEEKIVVGENTPYPLNGLLTFPDNITSPVPAVVLVHGSGASNMNEKVGKVTPFKDLAEGFAKRGIATIRYDKRSLVHGKALVKHSSDITVKEETIEDAIFATELLRQDSRIDSNKVFIIGHSMGGMLAPRIDAEGGNYRGIIIMAGSPRKLEEILVDQNNDLLACLNPIIRWIAKKQILKLHNKFQKIYTVTDDEAKKTAILGKNLKVYYLKEMGEHASPMYLKDLDKPVFIIQGSKDLQATVERDFNKYKSLLQHKSNVEFKLYEDLNHVFMPAVADRITKARKEYSIDRHIEENVIDDISGWILTKSTI